MLQLQPCDYQDASSVATDLLALLQQDEDDVLAEVLQRLLEDTGSPHGFCGVVDADGDLNCVLATQGLFDPEAEFRGNLSLSRDEWTGVWGTVLRERQSLISNAEPATAGVPPSVRRCLATPILSQDDVVGVVYVANRSEDYQPHDAARLELLVRPLAPAIRTRLQRQAEQRRTAESISKLVRNLDAEREAKQASQNSLQELEEMHRQILDATPAVVYVKDLDGRYRFINRRYEEIFHVLREEFIGQTDFDLFPAHIAQQFRENDLNVVQQGRPVKCREVADSDGIEHTHLSIKFPLRDAGGNIVSVAGISTDITELDQLKADLSRLTSLHTLILESIGDGILGIDCDGLTTFINPVASDLLGWSEGDLIGRPLHQFLGHEMQPLCDGPGVDVEVVVEDEEALFLTKSGRLEEVRFVSRPLLVAGSPAGAVISFRLLADERLREERERQQREAEQRQFEQDRQLRTIRALQLDRFPSTVPTLDGYEIGGCNEPQDIASGDFFDFIPLADGSLVIVVGDATGHDLASAFHMVEAHTVLHTLFDCEIPLDQLLPRLNQALCRHVSGRFVSLFVLRLMPETGRIEFAGAGHDATILRASGEIESLPSTGLVLGIDTSARDAQFLTADLQPGDEVLLLTDGFHETFSPDKRPFGRKRLFDAVKASRGLPVDQVIEQLLTETERHAGAVRVQDDRTAVMIRRLPETAASA